MRPLLQLIGGFLALYLASSRCTAGEQYTHQRECIWSKGRSEAMG